MPGAVVSLIVYYALLKVTGPLGSDLIFKEYRVVKKLLPLIATNNVVKLGDTTAISAITDGDTYSWFPTTNLNNSNAKEVLFTSKIPGKYKYTVTATQGTCSGSSTVVIDMRKPPENDNICNAIELKATENGPFINIDATVEFNEPAPKDTCCNCPLTWCDEGGLQNSVWFKYTVPEGVNTISIDSRGMDDQIAVYNSESCKSVKLSDLIAANDDYYDFPPYASAIEEIKVSPGKTYWIQVDGSAGGVADTFYITIKDGLLNNVTKNISGSSALKVFPNPNKGEFNVLLHSLANEPVTIHLFDLTGKLAFQKIVYKPAGELKTNISGKFSKGAYILRATSRSVSETGRLIIE